jgi:hypothetical protein
MSEHLAESLIISMPVRMFTRLSLSEVFREAQERRAADRPEPENLPRWAAWDPGRMEPSARDAFASALMGVAPDLPRGEPRPGLCPCPECQRMRARSFARTPGGAEAARRDLQSIVPHLRRSELLATRMLLQVGLIDGSLTSTCLFGVVAALRGTSYGMLGLGENPDRPFESWLAANVRLGDTPTRSRAAAQLATWFEEYLPLTYPDVPADEMGEYLMPLDEWLQSDPPAPAAVVGWRRAVQNHLATVANARDPAGRGAFRPDGSFRWI